MAPSSDAPSPHEIPVKVARWVCELTGAGSTLVRSRRLPGASSSLVHAVDLRLRHGRIVRGVLRRYVYPPVLASEPEPVDREAMVLHFLERAALPAPRLLGTDAAGDRCDAPALLMTRLPGRPRWRPPGVDVFLDGLVAQLPTIHALGPPTEPAFPRYHPYYDDLDRAVPSWTTRPAVWERAIEVRRSGVLAFTPTFIHRDYHPGNVLWQGSRLSGIVDWAGSCIGPAPVDVAHCRVNLALAISCDAADDFLRRAEDLGVVTGHDPTWDLIDAVDALPDLDDSRAALARLDEFVARAVAALGPIPRE